MKNLFNKLFSKQQPKMYNVTFEYDDKTIEVYNNISMSDACNIEVNSCGCMRIKSYEEVK